MSFLCPNLTIRQGSLPKPNNVLVMPACSQHSRVIVNTNQHDLHSESLYFLTPLLLLIERNVLQASHKHWNFAMAMFSQVAPCQRLIWFIVLMLWNKYAWEWLLTPCTIWPDVKPFRTFLRRANPASHPAVSSFYYPWPEVRIAI